MFCFAVSAGSRLNDWKTKPIRSRRSTVSLGSCSRLMSVSPRHTDRRRSGWSRPAAQCRKVLLPEPDGPITAVKDPRGRVTVDAAQRGHRGGTGPVPLGDLLESEGGDGRAQNLCAHG